MSHSITRRDFVRNSLIGLATTSLPVSKVFGQTTLKQRLDWDTFKLSRQYPSFVDAIAKMRDISDVNNKRSWDYWINSHVNYCPHDISYFLSWHRGYLYFFERQLRAVSGNPSLTLPYWDYYKNATIPAEFTNPASWNPLYQQRVNTNVSAALTLAPFDNTLTNMQRGLPNAFEPSMESMPHNPIHNIIGGVMANLLSPTDPIFWLHHANVDRLFSAWSAAPGRITPARTDAYWNNNFSYAPTLTLPCRSCISTRTDMGYFYQNETMPTSLSAPAVASPSVFSLRAADPDPVTGIVMEKPPNRPPIINFPETKTRPIGTTSLSIGGAKQIALDEASVTAEVKLDAAAVQAIQSLTVKLDALPFGATQDLRSPYSALKIVLDDVRLNGKGDAGGYFYKAYLQLPANSSDASTEDKYLLGNLGPFQISAAMHHGGSSGSGVRLVFPATDLLKNIPRQNLTALTVSFVRVSGKNSPQGGVITIGECRIEVADDEK